MAQPKREHPAEAAVLGAEDRGIGNGGPVMLDSPAMADASVGPGLADEEATPEGLHIPLRKTFNCFIIGEGTLPIQCAEILLRRGHHVAGLITDDESVIRWASNKNIRRLEANRDLAARLREETFDYLFSIVNPTILPKEVLALCRNAAINYHDSLLPRYAGTHATTWALLNRENVHGITWHIMSPHVDAGDILKQVTIPVDEQETAFTLNGRCYQAALSAFDELVDELSTGRVQRQPQSTQGRSFYSHSKRPAAGAILSWDRPAEELDALVRALDFGIYLNPLSVPKVALGDEFLLIPNLKVLGAKNTAKPGTITAIDRDAIRISTSSHDVCLSRILSMQGAPLPIPEIAAKFGLRPGHQLPGLTAEIEKEINQLNAAIADDESFWVHKLADLQDCEIPYARRTVLPRTSGKLTQATLDVPASLHERLKANFPDRSLRECLLAAFGVYLMRIGGLNRFDIAFRSLSLRKEVEGLEALFANAVPLTIRAEGGQRFDEVLLANRAELTALTRHRTYARDLFVRYRELHSAEVPRDYYNLSILAEEVHALAEATPGAEYDLSFILTKDGTGCAWFYDPEVIEPGSIVRMQSQFLMLLDGLAASPNERLAFLPLLTPAERQQVLEEWNRTEVSFPKDSTIPHLFDCQVKENPKGVAIVFGEQTLTYQELHERSNQLSHFLRRQGVGPEVMVGILVERSVEMVVGLLGVLKAGAAYVPLDPTYPTERLAFQLEETGVPILLTQQPLLPSLPPTKARPICLDKDWPQIAREATDNVESGPRSENLAYVIYTSGSTGKPKGVMVTHAAICNHLHWGQASDPLSKTDRVLQKTSIGFDVSVWEIFGPLLAGASLVIARDVSQDYGQLVNLINEQKITVLNFVPSSLSVFLDVDGVQKSKSLRRIFCGGEVLPYELQERFFSALNADLHNSYGVTEAAVDSTFWVCQRGSSRRIVPIGRPIANTQIYLLDTHLQPVPIGVPGEIHIGGAGLARGYLNRPELTAERFIASPFSAKTGERLYKTGDLARYWPDGTIELIGRVDHQVKVRGHRIELGEIEAVLLQHPGVREALVMTREDAPGDVRLVAYFIPAGRPTPARKVLQAYLREKLPASMIPSSFIALEAFPVLPNGKVNRHALPAPEKNRSELEGNFVAPRDTLEIQLARIWEKLLNLNSIGMRDNFFDLGGNSLLAARMFAQIDKVCGKKLPLATLFQCPTIEVLANALRQEGWSPSWSSLVPIQPRGSRAPVFFIHGVGGNVLNFRDLARHLSPDIPVYGLQSQGLDEKQAPLTRIEDMAAHYIKEIRALQPDGPYRIGGMSFGGLVAYEMAQQLNAAGEKVAVLAMLDTDPEEHAGQAQPYHHKLRSLLKRASLHLSDTVKMSPLAMATFFPEQD